MASESMCEADSCAADAHVPRMSLVIRRILASSLFDEADSAM